MAGSSVTTTSNHEKKQQSGVTDKYPYTQFFKQNVYKYDGVSVYTHTQIPEMVLNSIPFSS